VGRHPLGAPSLATRAARRRNPSQGSNTAKTTRAGESDMQVRRLRTVAVLVIACAAVGALLVIAPSVDTPTQAQGPESSEVKPAMSEARKSLPEPLICLWQHNQATDIGPLVKELGFNTVWTDDEAYHGQVWEETHMYRALQVPGVKYVIPKIERAAWGWTQEQSIASGKWIAGLSLVHKRIIGLYLNDFYDEIEEGHRTMEQWREIIAAIKSVNPDLKLWVPHYPHRHNESQAYDFPYDAVVFNMWDDRLIPETEKQLAIARKQHAGKVLIGGIYINARERDDKHWLTEQQFKNMLSLFVREINAGNCDGVRIFCACQMVQRPEYVKWAKEVLKDLKPAR
jgi:hypothetical protein